MKMQIVDVAQSAKVLEESFAKNVPTPLIITRDGQPLAVVLPTEGADVESVRLSFDPKFLAIIQDSRRSVATEGGIPIDEVAALFSDDTASTDERSA